MTLWLRIDPTACTGHGVCADLLPERIQLDEWGFPIIKHDVSATGRDEGYSLSLTRFNAYGERGGSFSYTELTEVDCRAIAAEINAYFGEAE